MSNAPDSLAEIAEDILACRRCPIGCNGTRAVAGEGAVAAALMIVGEQPGDMEEKAGRPFIGPAGRMLARHLENAGIDRAAAYVTNAVKHFKFVQRGKKRLHQRPTAGEIDACRFWLDAERRLVRPRVILALGASAARGVLGRSTGIQAARGQAIPLEDGCRVWITVHPSFLLRVPNTDREAESARFQHDIRRVARDLTTP